MVIIFWKIVANIVCGILAPAICPVNCFVQTPSVTLYRYSCILSYWNGKDEAGEQVSSGVYFYTIQAGGVYSYAEDDLGKVILGIINRTLI